MLMALSLSALVVKTVFCCNCNKDGWKAQRTLLIVTQLPSAFCQLPLLKRKVQKRSGINYIKPLPNIPLSIPLSSLTIRHKIFATAQIKMQSLFCTQVFMGACRKILRKATISFVMSVRLCVRMERLGTHCKDFHEIWYLGISWKFVGKNQVTLISDKNIRYFAWGPT